MLSKLNEYRVSYSAHNSSGKLQQRSKKVVARDADEARARLRQQVGRSASSLWAVQTVALLGPKLRLTPPLGGNPVRCVFHGDDYLGHVRPAEDGDGWAAYAHGEKHLRHAGTANSRAMAAQLLVQA